MTPVKRAPNRRVIGLLVALLCAIWGSTWIVIRGGLNDLPPFTSAAARFWVASALMIALAAPLSKREGGERPRAWLWLTTGVLNIAVSYAVVYWCETRLPSGLVAVLWGTFPILMALSTHWFLPGARLGAKSWIGFLLGFVGLVVLFRNDIASVGDGAIPTALVLFTSPIASAVGTTVIKRYGHSASSVLLNRNAMLVGATLLSVLALLTERDTTARWTAPALASIAYLAIAGSALTFGIYFWLLRYADAHKLSLTAYVTPAIALTLGWSIGGEPLGISTLVGTAFVLTGVVLVGHTTSPRSS